MSDQPEQTTPPPAGHDVLDEIQMKRARLDELGYDYASDATVDGVTIHDVRYGTSPAETRARLLNTAAIAVDWIERIDRRTKVSDPVLRIDEEMPDPEERESPEDGPEMWP